MKSIFAQALTVTLTGMVTIMALFTCIFILHQPEMPEELNDFRKYDR